MSWQFYLFLILLCLVVQGLFAMLEMAAVSFNKVRLQYYLSKDLKRAKWLSYLLNHPPLLFGTALIAINTALQVGSECSRRFYDALHLDPGFAPLSQVFLVLIFAEIAPLFAGRRYAEHAALLGVPILYAASFILRPFIWFLEFLCRLVSYLLKTPMASPLHLSRDELQKMLEEREEEGRRETGREFDTIASNIFTLKTKTAKDLMKQVGLIPMIHSTATVADLRQLLHSSDAAFVPLFHKLPQNIVAIAYPRDLLRLSPNKRIREEARSPWFVTEKSSILTILQQFRKGNQSVAVVLDESGAATGVLTLDEICDEIFARSDGWMSFEDILPRTHHIVVDRSFPADMRIAEFNDKFRVHLPSEGCDTLEELMAKELGHIPVKGETLRIDQFELTVEEASLLGVKMISVRTVY